MLLFKKNTKCNKKKNRNQKGNIDLWYHVCPLMESHASTIPSLIMAASTLHLKAIFQWGSHNSLLVQDIYFSIYICILHFKGSFKITIKNNRTKCLRQRRPPRYQCFSMFSLAAAQLYLCITLTLTNKKYIH